MYLATCKYSSTSEITEFKKVEVLVGHQEVQTGQVGHQGVRMGQGVRMDQGVQMGQVGREDQVEETELKAVQVVVVEEAQEEEEVEQI